MTRRVFSIQKCCNSSDVANTHEEVVDFLFQAHSLALQDVGRLADLTSRVAGIVRGRCHLDDVLGNFLCTVGGFLNVPRDFLGRQPLLFDRVLNAGGDLVHLLDRFRDALDRIHRACGLGLDRLDLQGDFFSRLGRLVSKFLDLGCNNGEALAGFPCPGCLDRCVQGREGWFVRQCP